MVRLLQFEIKKLFQSKYHLILIILLILAITSYFIYNYTQTHRVNDEQADAKRMLTDQEERLAELEEEDDSDQSNSDEKEIAENFISEYENEITALNNREWNDLLDQEIPTAAEKVEINQAKKNYNMVAWPTNFTEEVYYQRLVWLKENNIRPLLPITLFTEKTVYDQDFSEDEIEKGISQLHNQHSSSSVYFLYRLFGAGFGIIGVGFFLFLLGDILTKEGLNRQGPIHFLYTQPISRGKVIVSKYLTVLLTSLLIIIGSAAFSILLGVVFDRLGAWNYPVLIYEADASFHFMPMLSFIGLSTLLFFMLLIFSYALLFFFSMLTKRTIISIGLTFGVILLGVLFSDSADSSLAAYNPFHYFQVSEIIWMEFAIAEENLNMTLINGLSTLGIGSALLGLGTYLATRIR